MSDSIAFDVDIREVTEALARLGDAAQPFIDDASAETASAIVTEAAGRLSRQLGPLATGKTVAGIRAQPARYGGGSVVLSARDPLPALSFWLEKGTRHGHKQLPRPYFYISALLEEGAHFRRIAAAVEAAEDAVGLGS